MTLMHKPLLTDEEIQKLNDIGSNIFPNIEKVRIRKGWQAVEEFRVKTYRDVLLLKKYGPYKMASYEMKQFAKEVEKTLMPKGSPDYHPEFGYGSAGDGDWVLLYLALPEVIVHDSGVVNIAFDRAGSCQKLVFWACLALVTKEEAASLLKKIEGEGKDCA